MGQVFFNPEAEILGTSFTLNCMKQNALNSFSLKEVQIHELNETLCRAHYDEYKSPNGSLVCYGSQEGEEERNNDKHVGASCAGW